MNCKPGDLAFVVRDDFPENIGRIVSVIKSVPNTYDYRAEFAVWHVEPCGGPLRCWTRKGGLPTRSAIVGCFDKDLRPIRNPGDDAVDESLLWLPVPVKETA